MKTPTSHSSDLARYIMRFFQDYLPSLRGMSTHTIRSYRDAVMLYLRFAATRGKRRVEALEFAHFTGESVSQFVTFAERKRHNAIGTRNARLAALHTFARFAASEHPERLAEMQRVLAVGAPSIALCVISEMYVNILDECEVRWSLTYGMVPSCSRSTLGNGFDSKYGRVRSRRSLRFCCEALIAQGTATEIRTRRVRRASEASILFGTLTTSPDRFDVVCAGLKAFSPHAFRAIQQLDDAFVKLFDEDEICLMRRTEQTQVWSLRIGFFW